MSTLTIRVLGLTLTTAFVMLLVVKIVVGPDFPWWIVLMPVYGPLLAFLLVLAAHWLWLHIAWLPGTSKRVERKVRRMQAETWRFER